MMSRRDTIIIAVLLNAAILAVLFMMAVNTDDDIISDQSEFTHEIIKGEDTQPDLNTDIPPEPIAMATEIPADDVDKVLQDFSNSTAMEPIIPEDEPNAPPEVVVEKPAPKPIEKAHEGNIVEVTVKKGDVLERIARANGSTVDAIKKTNNLKTEKLKIGQVLKVPVGIAKKSTEAKKTNASTQSTSNQKKSTASSDATYYTVKNGDNPWKIAKQFQVKMDDLLKMNNLDEEKARNMKVGDRIRVR